MPTDLDVALEAAEAGVAVVAAGFNRHPEARLKGAVNPVTETDLAAESAILGVLGRLRPDDAVLAEESGGAGWDRDRVWIVDPLDGTVNFLHGIPQVAVSVALWVDGTPRVGVVADAIHGEIFRAEAGSGAWLDDNQIGVSRQDDLAGALVATGFPYDRQLHAETYARVFGHVLAEVQGIRRIGSAALDLTWVACGRFDGYWEYGLAPWDSAAAGLIVKEAGGVVTDHAGDEHRLDSATIVATNGRIHAGLVGILAGNHPEHLR